MLRAVKLPSGALTLVAEDINQAGEAYGGEWCSWTTTQEALEHQFMQAPADPLIRPLRWKENATNDGLEARTQEEMDASPDGL